MHGWVATQVNTKSTLYKKTSFVSAKLFQTRCRCLFIIFLYPSPPFPRRPNLGCSSVGVKKGLSSRLTNYVLLAQKKTLLKYTHVESRVEVLANMESTNEKKAWIELMVWAIVSWTLHVLYLEITFRCALMYVLLFFWTLHANKLGDRDVSNNLLTKTPLLFAGKKRWPGHLPPTIRDLI
jgi:hypothetical protein